MERVETKKLLVRGRGLLEETMVVAYHAIRETLKQTPALGDLRAAAFRIAIDKMARSYMDLGVFP